MQELASKEAQVDPVGAGLGPKFKSFEQLQASPSTNPSPRGFGKSPVRKVQAHPKKEIGFSLKIALETSPVQTRGEGTSLEPIQADLESLAEARKGPVSGIGEADPATPFPLGPRLGL